MLALLPWVGCALGVVAIAHSAWVHTHVAQVKAELAALKAKPGAP